MLRNITVQELSDKTDSQRITCHKHFADIYDVYEQLEKQMPGDVMPLIAEYGKKLNVEVLPAVFKCIMDHPKYVKMIFSPHHTSTLYQKILKTVEELNRLIWSEKYGADLKDCPVSCTIRSIA